jgi:hypothetical protein
MCWFLDAGDKVDPHAQLTGVQKAPRHEVAGSWAQAGQRVLWRFDAGAQLDDGRDISPMAAVCPGAREVGRLWEVVQRAFGADQGAIRTLMDAIGLSEIAAGAGPAYWKRRAASL